jgi:hypothetical protein
MIALLIILLLSSCMKTEIINAPMPMDIDTTATKVHKDFPADTTDRADTARVPIGWNPSVEDWSEQNQDIYGY